MYKGKEFVNKYFVKDKLEKRVANMCIIIRTESLRYRYKPLYGHQIKKL